MDVSLLMIHAQQIEEEKLKGKTRDSKRERRDDGESSHSRSDGGNHPQGKGGSEKMWPECRERRRRHEGKCLAGSNACFGCGKSGHKIRDFLILTYKGRDDRQDQTQEDHEGSPDVVIVVLENPCGKFLSFYLYQWFSGCEDVRVMVWIEGDGFEKTSGVCSQGGDSVLHGWYYVSRTMLVLEEFLVMVWRRCDFLVSLISFLLSWSLA
uniref:Zinc knuckle family protein n=1 Tax=Solanum tuberosum TaxID=4113 RepID=M1DQ60_SOLTU